NDWPKALEWLEKACELPAGAADATLVKQRSDLKLKMMQDDLARKESALAEDPNNEALREEINQLSADLVRIQTEEAQALVERYPNDPTYRFDLGKLLYESGEIDRAIQQFQ